MEDGGHHGRVLRAPLHSQTHQNKTQSAALSKNRLGTFHTVLGTYLANQTFQKMTGQNGCMRKRNVKDLNWNSNR